MFRGFSKGQVSLDFLLAIILFLVVISFFLSYVNNLDSETQIYNENISMFGDYIVQYGALKSINSQYVSEFKTVEINLPKDYSYTFINKTLTFIGQDNNYSITNISLNCSGLVCKK